MAIQTLSYGYQLPADGDTGLLFFPAMDTNITRLNGHTHNGTDSALIPASSIQQGSVTASSGAWGSAVSTGVYRQLLTMPAGYTFDASIPSVRLVSNGNLVYATLEKVSSTTFYVYTSDNSAGYTVIFK